MARAPRKSLPHRSWQEVFEFFMLFKRSQGLSERTLRDYRHHVPRFFRLTSAEIDHPKELRLAVLQYFADSASSAPATFNTRRKELKSFFTWAVAEGFAASDPMDGIRHRKEDDVPRSVEADVIKRLLLLPDKSTFAGLRDYGLLVLTMDTGIRPGEALRLRPENIDFADLCVTVPANVAKTRTTRILPLTAITADVLRRLLLARHPEWSPTAPVFCNENGVQFNSRSWNRRMERYSKMLGAKVRPYDLRHSFALYYLRYGGNAFGLQKTLGHTTMTMTRRYVALTMQDLKEQHTLASPINTLIPQIHRVRTTVQCQ